MRPESDRPGGLVSVRHRGLTRELPVIVDRAARSPLRRQLETALRDAIRAGRLWPGALRRNLAEYLGRVRGVVASAGQVLVADGFSQAIDLTFRVLAASGARRVAFEELSHDEQWEAARRAGLDLVPIPVDADGIRVADLARADPDAVVVTPAHQFPTGVVLESSRRRALLAWAAERNALIVEDDYDSDSEFRYDRAPVGTLQGLDPTHVLYVGTASKTLAPALRLGWMVIPPPLRDRFADAKRYADAGSPAIDQLALARLLATGGYERAIHKAKTTYRRRRDALLAAIAETLPNCQAEGIAAGLHVLLRLAPGTDEAADAPGRPLRPVACLLRPERALCAVVRLSTDPSGHASPFTSNTAAESREAAGSAC